jgi:hypothetical protein
MHKLLILGALVLFGCTERLDLAERQRQCFEYCTGECRKAYQTRNFIRCSHLLEESMFEKRPISHLNAETCCPLWNDESKDQCLARIKEHNQSLVHQD